MGSLTHSVEHSFSMLKKIKTCQKLSRGRHVVQTIITFCREEITGKKCVVMRTSKTGSSLMFLLRARE